MKEESKDTWSQMKMKTQRAQISTTAKTVLKELEKEKKAQGEEKEENNTDQSRNKWHRDQEKKDMWN